MNNRAQARTFISPDLLPSLGTLRGAEGGTLRATIRTLLQLPSPLQLQKGDVGEEITVALRGLYWQILSPGRTRVQSCEVILILFLSRMLEDFLSMYPNRGANSPQKSTLCLHLKPATDSKIQEKITDT